MEYTKRELKEEGNNSGVRYALKALTTDYILLLKNNTVVDKEFLNHCIKSIQKRKKQALLQLKFTIMTVPKEYGQQDEKQIGSGILVQKPLTSDYEFGLNFVLSQSKYFAKDEIHR